MVYDKIAAVEKQLHAALGERHKASITGAEGPTTLHELTNSVERHRKRLKLLEDVDGLSKLARVVK